MTPVAFQLGAMLTQGWFWTRRCGGAAVYRGPTLAQVDFRHILRVAGPEPGDIVLPAGLSHPPNSTCCYVVRRFNHRGDLERTTAAAALVRLGPDGQLAPPAPNRVLGLTARQIAGCKLRLTWLYAPLDQETAPGEFRVCWDAATGSIDEDHPLATIPCQGHRSYQYETGPLGEGRYTFVVRSGDAHHTAAASCASIVCSITGLPPAAPTILGTEAV